MTARRRILLATGATVTAVGLLGSGLAQAAPGDPAAPRYAPGAAGAGDPYFPLAGNGGTDVLHYDLDLRLLASPA